MTRPLLALSLDSETDLVLVRQQARRIAELVGFDRQDQTRIAAATSELARAALGGGGGSVDFRIDGGETDQALAIAIRGRLRPEIAEASAAEPAGRGGPSGIAAARRLMDHYDLTAEPGGGHAILVQKRLPRNRRVGADRMREIGETVRREPGGDALELLREQNHELVLSFAELRSRQEELQRLNRELEDTNRGIVALYSELDQKAEQLREASELKSRFLSYVSHEFRTPLNSILGLTRILLDRLDGDLSAEQERQVVYIRQSADSLTELVNDLLDLAKVEAGRLELKPTVFAVADLFAALRGALKPLLTTSAVDLVLEIAPGMPRLRTDEGKVGQILRNLISNALKFTEAGGVRVEASVGPTGTVVFSVADTGIGIAPEHLDKIFEEFSQVDGPLQRRQKGTGLGLPLSRKLAQLMGGSLDVESAVGEGSLFRLTLPAAVAVGDDPIAPPKNRPPSAAAVRRRVLVVDDEPAFRYLVRQALRDVADIDILEAADGGAAVSALADVVPDLVLLDLEMPMLDGFGVLAAVRRDPRLRAVPVVVATSHPITADLKARLPGVDALLPKSALDRAAILEALGLAEAIGRRETLGLAEALGWTETSP
ncbi:ATP-binding response regulator [Mongoliimonas terrestris]|uniref:ATP-binding response regulator n=1 Tax=Mongoliimonas terrestris TaxID=1709001 RepID=UPI000949A7D0|nr:ATP-binding protein [Mongoliimonas terrestris]